MICALMQPTYIPWIGYFDLIDKVDKFVFYDDVQLAKRSWQVRNKIKGSNGEVWLTIPILKSKSRDDTLIHEAQINYSENWLKTHLKSIAHSYGKSPFFEEVFEVLKLNYTGQKTLGDFNIGIITEICKKIGISTDLVRASELTGIIGNKDERLASICKAIGANQYLSPQGSADYINLNNQGGLFPINDITLYYHDYEHPQYPQLHKEFIPYIGIYDLMFNVGFGESLGIIREGRRDNINYRDL